MSCHSLKEEIDRSQALWLSYVVIHPGSHMGTGENNGISQISDNINFVFSEFFNDLNKPKPLLLLETTAGQGTNLGYKFEQLASIIKNITDKNRLGICLDTCHIFAAGYDIRSKNEYENTIKAFNDIIGIENLHLIHINDSKMDLGSRIDRHEHIGKGKIGVKAFSYLMNDERLAMIPKIIETPKGEGIQSDLTNLNILKNLI
ncbi:MAG: deoxyribonuclease IV [Desulfobacterales bacterium]|nr:deoxyribonuclease IV [Desulfobacterales bacterium]MBF0397681.1 deoxyribonuclease IV [Desulfobacterales bacterium]